MAGAGYEYDLGGLRATFDECVRHHQSSGWGPVLRDEVHGHLTVIASGGALPVASMAADLHTNRCGETSEAITPLMFVSSPAIRRSTTTLIISATARHPDAAMAASAAIRRGHRVLLLTQRSRSDLPSVLRSDGVEHIQFPQVQGRDGFLATKSAIGAATFIGLLNGVEFPDVLPSLRERPDYPAVRSRCIVLYGDQGGRAVAEDLESRFSESGLSAVQLCDYRSLGHGRHFGLARHHAETSIINVDDGSIMGRETLNVLPADVDRIDLPRRADGFVGVVDQLVQSMHLPVSTARQEGVHLARPGVTEYGRRLYHLKVETAEVEAAPPVVRKLIAAEMTSAGRAGVEFFEDAWRSWIGSAVETRFDALILDYDGTVVETRARWEPPTRPVQDLLLNLWSRDVCVSFASGRGDSLTESLRSWVPRSLWPSVPLALHNGAWMTDLESATSDNQTSTDSSSLSAFLDSLGTLTDLGVSFRIGAGQITVSPGSSQLSVKSLFNLCRSFCRRGSSQGLTVVASGHSVDIVLSSSNPGKLRAYTALVDRGLSPLSIGDRGDVGGNDFELLASNPWTLSVDRCSPDPSRCWGVTPAGLRGPSALLYILGRAKVARGKFRLDPRMAKVP